MCTVRRVPAGTSSVSLRGLGDARSSGDGPTAKEPKRKRFTIAVVIAACVVVLALAVAGCVRNTSAPAALLKVLSLLQDDDASAADGPRSTTPRRVSALV